MDLHEHGRTEEKLAAEIAKFEGDPGSSTASLKNLLSRDGHNRFQLLRDLITDLSVAAEDGINRKPEPDPDWGDFFGPEHIEAQRRRWRQRAAAHRLSKGHPIREFIRVLRPLWLSLSERPFTEGMHHAELGTTVPAVDAIEMVLTRLDPSIERSSIVTAMRNLRKTDASDAAS